MIRRAVAQRFMYVGGVCACMLAVAGCGEGRVKTHPVRGEVTYQGHPVTTGTVTFSPVAPRLPAARGSIQPDGTFSLSTFQPDDGAAAGEHVVMISSFSGPVAKPELPADDPRQRAPTPLVPIRYTSIRETPLRVTVEGRENDVQLTLVE